MYPWLCIHSCFQSPPSLLKNRSCFWDSLTSRTTQSHSSFAARRSHFLLRFYNVRYTFQTTEECNFLSSDRLFGQPWTHFVTPVELKQIMEGQESMLTLIQWVTGLHQQVNTLNLSCSCDNTVSEEIALCVCTAAVEGCEVAALPASPEEGDL